MPAQMDAGSGVEARVHYIHRKHRPGGPSVAHRKDPVPHAPGDHVPGAVGEARGKATSRAIRRTHDVKPCLVTQMPENISLKL